MSRDSSPYTQALIDIFGDLIQLSSKTPLERKIVSTYNAVCSLLRASENAERSGCLMLDGWIAALQAPVLGITWNFIDERRRFKCLSLTTLNTHTDCNSSDKLRSIFQGVLESNMIVGSNGKCVHHITSDKEPSVALAVDLLANYVGSVRCLVHTLALPVDEVIETYTPWK